MLAAAKKHLSFRDQRDTLTAHFEFPNRTTAGPAIITVEDVKLGRKISTLHLTLWQGGLLSKKPWIKPSISNRSMLAYATQTDLSTFDGISLPTGYEVTPDAALPQLPEFEKLKTKRCDNIWEESKLPNFSGLMRSLRNWEFCVPRAGPLTPGVLDMWIRLTSGELIKHGALPYVVDSFPYNLNHFLATPELRKLMLEEPQEGGEKPKVKSADDERSGMWFPTVVMNLEVKMPLPEEGLEWLNLR